VLVLGATFAVGFLLGRAMQRRREITAGSDR
jgi:hypothetical protein